MNCNETGKLQLTLLSAYISWKRLSLHTLIASLEEVIVMHYEEVKAKYMKEDPSKHLSWWRRLEDVFRLRLQKMSWRCLEDVLIQTNMFALSLRLQKTSSRHPRDILVKTIIFVSAIRLQDISKTFSRRLQDVLRKHLQDVLKTPSRCLQDIFKTSSRRLAKISSIRFQGVKLNCSC